MTSKGRIPSLDGLRAISVLLVVFSHSFPTVKHYIDLGNLGVRMFFIISSYLITGILYRDVIKNRFSLKTFYFKRIMRTFPAFYFFLGGLLLVLLSFGLFDWEQFWRAPIYLENYHPRNLWNQKQWFVGHSWSLAVEEQFYLLIAGLFYLFHKKTISKKGVIRFFIGIIILVPLIRIGYLRLDFIPEVFTGSMHRSFETVCDALAVGALGFLMKEKALSFSRKYFTWYYLLSVAVLVFILGALNASEIREIFGYTPRYLYNSIGIFVIHLGMLFILFYLDKAQIYGCVQV